MVFTLVNGLRFTWVLVILFNASPVQAKVAIPSSRDVIMQLKVTRNVNQKRSHGVMARTFLSQPNDNDRFRLLGLDIRGGSDDEDEDVESEESDNEGDDDDEKADGTALDLTGILESAANITQSTVLPYTKKAALAVYKFTKKMTITTVKAIQRAIQAGLEGEEESDETEEQEVTLVERMVATIQRMVKAALTFPTDEDDAVEATESTDSGATSAEDGEESSSAASDEEVEVKETKPKTIPSEKKETTPVTSTKASDFGTFLATSYGVKDARTTESGAVVLGGSLTTALQEARAQARLLVVFLPAEKPNKKSSDSKEYIAIESILSPEVGEAANQRARSKGEDTGSFLFWGAKVGSAEASTAMKRLKVKPKISKGSKVPTLLVVYPAMVVDSSTGQSKLVPNVVAQHHCSPPPSSTVMVGWLNSLRKRHAKQYAAMQTVLKELQYFKERTAGYKDSAKNDKEREQREKEEEERRLVAEKAEQERLEAIETRRKELLAALPEEPTGKDTKKIALRFFDGRSGQRQFNPEQPLIDVFNWVDAMYEIEREKVILTTMNGKNNYAWDEKDKSLDDLGLGKNVGFRVSIKDDDDEDDASLKKDS